METPDLTPEDLAGLATIVPVLATALTADEMAVKLTAVVMIGLIGIAVAAAGAYRRGKRVENIDLVVEHDAATDDTLVE